MHAILNTYLAQGGLMNQDDNVKGVQLLIIVVAPSAAPRNSGPFSIKQHDGDSPSNQVIISVAADGCVDLAYGGCILSPRFKAAHAIDERRLARAAVAYKYDVDHLVLVSNIETGGGDVGVGEIEIGGYPSVTTA